MSEMSDFLGQRMMENKANGTQRRRRFLRIPHEHQRGCMPIYRAPQYERHDSIVTLLESARHNMTRYKTEDARKEYESAIKIIEKQLAYL